MQTFKLPDGSTVRADGKAEGAPEAPKATTTKPGPAVARLPDGTRIDAQGNVLGAEAKSEKQEAPKKDPPPAYDPAKAFEALPHLALLSEHGITDWAALEAGLTVEEGTKESKVLAINGIGPKGEAELAKALKRHQAAQ